jgi:uroporphyrinogen-III synthase
LLPLRSGACALAVGQGTAAALRRHGIVAQAPARQDSEGLLDLPVLHAVQGRGVALIGAAAGRDLLPSQLRARGACLREVWVYRRTPPHLDRRHVDALMRLPADARVLLSSAQALAHLQEALPAPAWQRLRNAVAVVSSGRLADAARMAGFARRQLAASAAPGDLLAAAATGT